ncbi:MAG: AI-2E family transporter, partial [Clostridia bacterium]|nr:AI-2E family transporter [Clostridia bacterium]
LGTVIGGLFIAFVLNVLLRAFENGVFRRMKQGNSPVRRKLVRPVSLICSLLIAFGIVALLLVVVIPQLSKTISELADKLPGYIAATLDWLAETLALFGFSIGSLTELSIDWTGIFEKIANFLGSDGAGDHIGTATGVGATVVGAAIDMIFSTIIAVYILAKKEKIGAFTKRCINSFFPEKVSRQILRIAALSDETFSNFISGQLMDSLILGLLCYIGMRIFKFPYPEVIAVVIGVTSLVPMIGSFIGEVVGAFLILFVNPPQALLFLVFILCLQQIEGSFIYPKIVGKSVGLPGVIVLCAVITGGKVAGVLGALMSVPVCAVLFTLLRETLDSREREGTVPHKRRT